MNNIVLLWYSKIVFKLQPDEIKLKFRQLETQKKKVLKIKLHLEFNRICLKEDLLPIYTNFKLHDAEARDEEFVHTCRRSLIERQIVQQQSDIERLEEECVTLDSQLRTSLNSQFRYDALHLFLQRTLNTI